MIRIAMLFFRGRGTPHVSGQWMSSGSKSEVATTKLPELPELLELWNLLAYLLWGLTTFPQIDAELPIKHSFTKVRCTRSKSSFSCAVQLLQCIIYIQIHRIILSILTLCFIIIISDVCARTSLWNAVDIGGQLSTRSCMKPACLLYLCYSYVVSIIVRHWHGFKCFSMCLFHLPALSWAKTDGHCQLDPNRSK